MWKARAWWMIGGLLITVGIGQIGCSSSDDSGESSCTGDFDCDFEERCNLELGECEPLREDNDRRDSPDTTSVDPAGDAGMDTHTRDGQDTADPQDVVDDNLAIDSSADTAPDDDTSPVGDTWGPDTGRQDSGPSGGCQPACAANEQCQAGVCMPNGSTCTAEGESCDPQLVDQGAFTCAPDNQGNGTCLSKCTNLYSPTECDNAEYCFNVNTDTDPVGACVPSQCQAHGDCSSGTCINYDNQFGLCVASGMTSAGASCDPAATNSCSPGLICREEPVDSGQGVCRALCNPWTETCTSPQQACTLYAPRDGVCSPGMDATGTQPFDACTTPGDMCDDGVRCLSVGQSNVCLAYCRTGMNDCAGLSFNGSPAVCDNYIIAGVRSWGVCFPSCTSDAECGNSAQCLAGICRSECTPGNVVQDCCDGDMDCDWSCSSSGFCQ